jgi:hypothetical protein
VAPAINSLISLMDRPERILVSKAAKSIDGELFKGWIP